MHSDQETCSKGLDLDVPTRNEHHIRTLVYDTNITLSQYFAPCIQLISLKPFKAGALKQSDK